MSTNQDQFETYYTAAKARLQFEADRANPPVSIAVDYELREYFAALYRFAPSLASQPIVAASWLWNTMKTQRVGLSDIAALCRTELDARRVRESERRRLLEIWHLLMRDPDANDTYAAQTALDIRHPREAAARFIARKAVLDWLRDHRPELGAPTEF